jgi:20S proteasome alpha/beta subunit
MRLISSNHPGVSVGTSTLLALYCCCDCFWNPITSWKVEASSSSFSPGSKSYNVYNYDQTTPQFTPDGRLLQVEYASLAAEHSSPLVALLLPMGRHHHQQPQQQGGNDKKDELANRDEQALVLVTVKTMASTTSTELDQESNSVSTTSTTASATSPTVLACHNRLVIVPSPVSSSEDVVIAMSGVLADCVALLQKMWKESSRHYQQFQTTMSVQQIAQVMADACQTHTFGGGIRPFGATMLVCGMAQSASRRMLDSSGGIATPTTTSMQMIQTDPSGAMNKKQPSHYHPPLQGKNHHHHRTRRSSGNLHNKKANGPFVQWIVGGKRAEQRQIQADLERELSRIMARPSQPQQRSSNKSKSKSSSQPSQPNVFLDGIAVAVRTLLKQQQEKQSKSGIPSFLNNNKRRLQNSFKNQPVAREREMLEIVVLSPTLGVHRLSDVQLDAVWNRIRTL